MRVANTMVYNMVQSNLENSTRALNDAAETAITGKRILALSDDPIGVSQSLGIRSGLDGFEQVERGISLGNTWLTASENALTQSQNLITDTKTLAIQMANASISPADRIAAAEIVQNTLEEIISLANTKVDDRYLFSGSKTNAAAFTLETKNDPAAVEPINTITYNGDETPFSIKIGDSTVAIGNNGDEIFTKMFETLANFKIALINNTLVGTPGIPAVEASTGPPVVEAIEAIPPIPGIQDAMDNLDGDFEILNGAITSVGTKMNRMDIKEIIYQDLTLSETARLSGIEDADITEAITNLQQKQLAYQAALSASAKVMELSLLDYV
ncbi:MAG: flagellar hook-associated protein FlgL [Desulfobacterium sp.]